MRIYVGKCDGDPNSIFIQQHLNTMGEMVSEEWLGGGEDVVVGPRRWQNHAKQRYK